MAVELLNCLALRKLLFINILRSYGFSLKCLIQRESKLIWISLQTELLMGREDVLLFNIERLKWEDRFKKGVSQYTNNILSTCCYLVHWLIRERKCLRFLSIWDYSEDVCFIRSPSPQILNISANTSTLLLLPAQPGNTNIHRWTKVISTLLYRDAKAQ